MLGLSYPEAQTATWMSYDTTIQDFLQKDLKKPFTETCKNLMQNNRLCNRDLTPVHLMTTFQLMKESVKTSLQMSTAPNMIWSIMSSNVLDSWYVMKNRRHREADGAFRWRLIRQKLKFTFLKQGGDAFTDRDLINNIWKGSSKTRFKYCQNSCGILLYIRALQGHIGRDLIEAEVMGHVAIPFKWKQFLFHRGCSFNLKSILVAGLVAGRKESREGRQTVGFTHLDPWRNEIEEQFQGDMSKPRRVHCKTEWKRVQDAMYWIHLAGAQ